MIQFAYTLATRLQASPRPALSTLFAEILGTPDSVERRSLSTDINTAKTELSENTTFNRASYSGPRSSTATPAVASKENISLQLLPDTAFIPSASPRKHLSSFEIQQSIQASLSTQSLSPGPFARSAAPSPCASRRFLAAEVLSPSASFCDFFSADDTQLPENEDGPHSIMHNEALPLFLPEHTPLIDWRSQLQSSTSLISLNMPYSVSITSLPRFGRQHIRTGSLTMGGNDCRVTKAPGHGCTLDAEVGLGLSSGSAHDDVPTLAALLEHPSCNILYDRTRSVSPMVAGESLVEPTELTDLAATALATDSTSSSGPLTKSADNTSAVVSRDLIRPIPLDQGVLLVGSAALSSNFSPQMPKDISAPRSSRKKRLRSISSDDSDNLVAASGCTTQEGSQPVSTFVLCLILFDLSLRHLAHIS